MSQPSSKEPASQSKPHQQLPSSKVRDSLALKSKKRRGSVLFMLPRSNNDQIRGMTSSSDDSRV